MLPDFVHGLGNWFLYCRPTLGLFTGNKRTAACRLPAAAAPKSLSSQAWPPGTFSSRLAGRHPETLATKLDFGKDKFHGTDNSSKVSPLLAMGPAL